MRRRRTARRRPARLLAAVAFAAFVPAALGCTSVTSGDDALVVYSGRNESLVGPLIERFEKDTGIDVDVRYGGSAELAAQLLEEGDATRADVFFAQDAGALGALAKADALRELPAALLSRVPAKFRAADARWVGVSGRARVIAYNARKVSAAEVPKTVSDVVTPRWRNRVGFAPTNASFQSFVTAMRVLAGETATRAWLRDLAANEPQEYPNNVQVLAAVERGEVDLGLINHYYWFEQAKEVGASKMRAQLAFLSSDDPGALVNVAGAAVVGATDRAEDAERFVDYLLATSAQEYFRDVTFEYPLVPGTAPAPGLPPLAQVAGPDIDLSDLDSLEQTLALLDEVGII